MDRRKSLAAELALKNKETPELRPLRRRSSIVPRVNSDPLEINDDSVERGRARNESITSTPTASTSHSRRSLNLASVAQLSNPQIAAGIAECIKLNTQNKITKKNAFNLKMIDFMTYMIKNRDEQMSNLQVASTTLDVSTKIYALRVDVLHQETMDMVGNLDHEKVDNNDGDDNNDDNYSNTHEDIEKQIKPKKKKKSKAKVLTTIESLTCEPEIIKLEPPMLGDNDFQTSDMLLQITAPRHVGFGIDIHPYNDYILDHTKSDNQESNESTTWNNINLPENIGKIFTEFEFLDWDPQINSQNQTNEWSQLNTSTTNDPMRFDLDASLNIDDINDNFHDTDGYHMQEAPVAGFVGGRKENIVDADDILNCISTVNDYSYFDEKAIDIRWQRGTQWTVKNQIKNIGQTSHLIGQRQESGRRKKDFSIDFRDKIDEIIDNKFIKMKKMKTKFKSFEDKITKPDESCKTLDDLFKFSLRPDDTYLKPKKRINENIPIEAENEDINIDDYGDLGDSRNFDDPIDNDNSIDRGDNLITQQEGFTQNGFIGTNLVEAPKLTEKIYIPFSQRAKKLDMRQLKKCIWNSINSKIDDKENFSNKDTDSNEKNSNNEPKSFANIYTNLPEKLSKNDAKELSFPIAFVSLLHLANEKNLILKSSDFSDIIVTVDST